MPETLNKTGVPVALTIAGSDSGGGAGIQADLKTFSAFGVFGTSAITALTSQNTLGVQGIHPVPAEFVAKQIDSVCTDLSVAAVKIGMLGNAGVIETVAGRISSHRLPHIVLDTVMSAKSGDLLLEKNAVDPLVNLLFPLAEIITPNTDEAEAILGIDRIGNLEEMKEAARLLGKLGAKNVLIKGGHITRGASDVLFSGGNTIILEGRYVDTPHTHGTGCTLSSALAAGLAFGKPVREAALDAKEYIQGAIEHALSLGSGRGPLNHMHHLFSEKPA